MARPSKYTKSLGDKICRRLAEGESLNAICKDPKLPHRSTVINWALDPEHEFYDKYARAREIQAELLADEIFDISDDGTNDWMTRRLNNGEEIEVQNHEAMQRSRLRVDSRKWYLSKIVPRFKDKVVQEHTGPNGGPVEVQQIFNVNPVRPKDADEGN